MTALVCPNRRTIGAATLLLAALLALPAWAAETATPKEPAGAAKSASQGGTQYVSQAETKPEKVKPAPTGPEWLHWWTGRSFMGKVWLLIKILVICVILRYIVKIVRSMLAPSKKE